MRPENISVIVTSYNESRNIARCLESVRGFGETVLVDSFSTDETLDIARRFPVNIYQRPYRSAAAQKNWALAVVQNRWVLILDADEAVSGELRAEIEALSQTADGYWIRRSSEYLGRSIRGCGWQRDKVLRLFDRTRGRYPVVEVHEEVALDGKVGMLEGRLIHYPYADIHHHLRKINEYTSRGARECLDHGEKFALAKMFLHPPFRFLRMYILQRGFLDGAPGLTLCLLSSYSVLLKYAKAWESRRKRHQ